MLRLAPSSARRRLIPNRFQVETHANVASRKERKGRKESLENAWRSLRPLREEFVSSWLRIGISHRLKLQCQGEALLAQPAISAADEGRWQARAWRYLDQVAGRRAFRPASQCDREEVGPVDLLAFGPGRTEEERERLVRRRIQRRLITLASVIEKVEALAGSGPRQRR